MEPSIKFPFSDEELGNAGLLDQDVSEITTEMIKAMRARPQMLRLSLFAIQCVEFLGQQRSPLQPLSHSSSTSSDESILSPGHSLASEPTTTKPYEVSDYEKAAYYNGVMCDGDHPILVYRSDYATNPFPKPSGRFGHPPSQSAREVYGTSLNPVWKVVGPQIWDVVNALEARPFSIDATRFVSYGDDDAETLGPPVVWVGIPPGSVDCGVAHTASQAILEILAHNGAQDVVVQWREAVLSKMAGPALMDVVGNSNPTAHLRRPFTSALNVPLATRERESEDSQGSVTCYFHENRDSRGELSTAVLAISNCHVLRENTKIDYKFKGAGAAKKLVRCVGTRQFQKVLNYIKSSIGNRSIVAAYYTRHIVRLENKQNRNEDDENELTETRANLDKENKAIETIERFYNHVKSHWSDISDRNIGFLRTAKAINVDVYTEDWAAFQLDEAKFKANFKGTTVDLGTEIAIQDVTSKFHPQNNTRTAFKYPEGRMYEIESAAPPELLADPDLFDNEGRPCLIVGKDGTKTGLTFGRYAGLESYVCDDLGVKSTELAIYNLSKKDPIFSGHGDSGALIWDGNHRAVGQLHSGMFKGGSTSSHVAYASPFWWLMKRVEKEYPHAVFFNKTWSL